MHTGYAKASQYYVTGTVHIFPVLFCVKWQPIGREYSQWSAIISSTYLPKGQLHQLNFYPRRKVKGAQLALCTLQIHVETWRYSSIHA